ncbi:unnamed protein product [Effrenium voratum]|nr:unnamed protein product [Effrenium voratum]
MALVLPLPRGVAFAPPHTCASQTSAPRASRTTPGTACAACAAFVASRGAQAIRTRARTARRAEGRPVRVVVEQTARQDLPGCSVEWMDKVMEDKATEVLFSGVERTEKEGDVVYLFFPSMDIGPFTSQVRMTCKIRQSPCRAEIQVLGINPGLLNNDTGVIEYQKDFEELLEAKTEIVLRWQGDSSGLRLHQQALQRFKYYMPNWFPVPDAVTEAVMRTFIGEAIRGGHEEVFRTLQKEARADR